MFTANVLRKSALSITNETCSAAREFRPFPHFSFPVSYFPVSGLPSPWDGVNLVNPVEVSVRNLLKLGTMNPVSVLVIIITANTNALLLCDGDCTNNPDINVCQKEPKDSDITDIVLLGLFPCNTPSFRAGGLTAAAQMAIRQISYNGNNSNLLKGYRLQLLVNESMVSCHL